MSAAISGIVVHPRISHALMRASRVALFLVRNYRGHAVPYAAFGPKPKVNGWRTCETRRLPKFPALWEEEAMNLRRLLNLVQAILVIAGLAVAPLVAPGAATRGMAAGMADMSMSAESMAADMPCCPDKNSMDCQDCPLVAMCVLQNAQAGVPSMAALPLRYAIRTAHVVRNDTLAAGLDRPPPDQPPRSQV